MPIAVIGSVLLTAVIYIALQVAFVGSLDPSVLTRSGSWANLSFQNDFGPLAALATALGLGWLAVMLYVDAVISPGDTGLIYTTVTSRITFAMARNGNAPKILAKTTNRGVPAFGLLLAFVVGLIAFLPFPSWQQLVGFITSATVLSFASGPLVHAALRQQIPDQERPFRLPGGHVIPLLAFWGSNLIVYWSGWSTVWKLMVAVLIGFAALGVMTAAGQFKDRSFDIKSGIWVLVWLAGLTLISFLGDYAGGLGVIHFGVAIPIVLVLSVIIYVMAYKMRLSPEQAKAYIEESLREAAVEDDQLEKA